MIGIGRGEGRGWPAVAWRRRILAALGLVVAVAMPLTVAGADSPLQSARLSIEDQADLQRIAAYLNGITTMTARFYQRSTNGGPAGGWLWMERPGRMRFQYDPPNPILLLADRFYIYYIDTQLAEVSQVGLRSTPAWFLLRVPISFADLDVTRFTRGDNSLQVTVVDPKAPDQGSLTMLFTDHPMALRQWTIIDQQRHVTSVSLSQHAVERDIDNKASTALNQRFIGLNGGPKRRFLSGDAGFEKPPDITADRPPVERPPRVAAACVRVGPIEDFGRLQVRPVEEERPAYRLIDHGEVADRLDKASRGKPQFLHDNRRNACRFRLLAIGQVKDSGRRIRQAHADRIGSHRIDRNQIQRCSRLAQYADAAVRMRKAPGASQKACFQASQVADKTVKASKPGGRMRPAVADDNARA